MDTEVTLTVREQKRKFVTPALAPQVQVIPKFLPGDGLAAGKLDLSLRQLRRLSPQGHRDDVAAYRRDGPAGLVQGNGGWPLQLPLLLKILAKGGLTV